ncbi:MAG: HDOD domain-containing protein [Treponema sp.]|nr:HDOD domain-containing protein [Treponema sp.]
MTEDKRLIVDSEKIKKAATSGVPLSLTTYVLPHEMILYMNDVLTCFLTSLNQAHMTDYLVYCLNELSTNAKKANTKRIYFLEKNLDINNPEDYEEGMKTFKMDMLENLSYFLEKQREAGLYIKVVFVAKNNNIKLEVRNNSELNIFEYKRIHDKICRAHTYTSMEEALDKVVDDTEGAGLGFILMILMLKKIGLTDESYQIFVENKETVVRVELPFLDKRSKDFDVVSKELLKHIEDLPSFPENIVEINRLIVDPDSDMAEIASFINNDVALTADLIKMVNSAAFRPANPVQNVLSAVKMVGLDGLRNLLFSLGTFKLLGENTEEKRQMWVHAHKVAFFSHTLASSFCATDKNIMSDAYVCGLLHDIGKVIFTTTHTEAMRKLVSITQQKNISFQVIEQMIAGSNHEILGARIAEKWNFPKPIIASIKYHHSPEEAPKEYKKLTTLIALANQLCGYLDEKITFQQVYLACRETFGLQNEMQFQSLAEKTNLAYIRSEEKSKQF